MPKAYEAAGVNIAAGDAVVAALQKLNQPDTHVLSGIGAFAGAYALPSDLGPAPFLVAGADGVGTKVILAAESGKLATIGQDLLAMCVNDVLAQGALPLFFLDYLAVAKLDVRQVRQILAGLVSACRSHHITLLGGETAEMPGVYRPGMVDLAGFAVGLAQREALLANRQSQVGDVLLALPASGLHSNGFSLVRKVLFEDHDYQFKDRLPGVKRQLIDELLTPTRIYTAALRPLLQAQTLVGVAHITGGGLLENVPRMLQADQQAVIDLASWTPPAIFAHLIALGQLSQEEAFQTFNMGVGMVLAVPPAAVARTEALLDAQDEAYWRLGVVARRPEQAPPVALRGAQRG